MPIDVSILICTRNRAGALQKTLAAIADAVKCASRPSELVVVDNGSTDDTATVVLTFAETAGFPVRHIVEARPGKCVALNCALGQIDSDVVLFTDDDVLPRPDWINRMTNPLLQGQADAIAGAVVIPEYLHRRLPHNAAWLASTGEMDLTKPDRMVGANMAVSRRVLARIPAFDAELGPGAMGFGDESLFSYQLLRAGFRLAGAPDAVVEHHFDPSRLTRRAMLDAARKMGASEAYLAYHWRHQDALSADEGFMDAGWRLMIWRLMRFWHLFDQGLPRPGELYWVFARGFSQQMRATRGQPRNYVQFGLNKICAHQ